MIKLSEHTITDYEPKESEANIAPFIRGVVVADSNKPYRRRKRLNESQKVAGIVVAALTILAAAMILLPLVFKFLLLVCCYLFIFIVSKGSYTVPSRGGKCARVPGSAIVPRS